MIIIIFFSKKVINFGFFEQFKIILPYLGLSLSMGVIMYFSLLLTSNAYLQLIISSLSGLIIYFLFSKIFNFKEFYFLLSLLKRSKGIFLNYKL
jgi:hypothetical protein